VASCSYILTLGKRHPMLAPSSYKTCITPTQAKKLFGTDARPEPLGCGVFACVFAHADPNKVVKITRDPSDVAGLVQGQGLPQVPKLYEQHKLAHPPRWTTPRRREHSWQEWPDQPEAYALVVERLRPLTGAEKSKWNQRIRRMLRWKQDQARKEEIERGEAPTIPANLAPRSKIKLKDATVGELARAVCPKAPARETAACQLRVRELNKMHADLLSRGIDWLDMHAGNIGVDKRGRWKALDLGASPTPLREEPPILAGQKRKR
jgi:hypothetical protein